MGVLAVMSNNIFEILWNFEITHRELKIDDMRRKKKRSVARRSWNGCVAPGSGEEIVDFPKDFKEKGRDNYKRISTEHGALTLDAFVVAIFASRN